MPTKSSVQFRGMVDLSMTHVTKMSRVLRLTNHGLKNMSVIHQVLPRDIYREEEKMNWG